MCACTRIAVTTRRGPNFAGSRWWFFGALFEMFREGLLGRLKAGIEAVNLADYPINRWQHFHQKKTSLQSLGIMESTSTPHCDSTPFNPSLRCYCDGLRSFRGPHKCRETLVLRAAIHLIVVVFSIRANWDKIMYKYIMCSTFSVQTLHCFCSLVNIRNTDVDIGWNAFGTSQKQNCFC